MHNLILAIALAVGSSTFTLEEYKAAQWSDIVIVKGVAHMCYGWPDRDEQYNVKCVQLGGMIAYKCKHTGHAFGRVLCNKPI